jgi:hypothetical protein
MVFGVAPANIEWMQADPPIKVELRPAPAKWRKVMSANLTSLPGKLFARTTRADLGSELAPHWARVRPMDWYPPSRSIAERRMDRGVWDSIREELRELAWLASVIGVFWIAGMVLTLVFIEA